MVFSRTGVRLLPSNDERGSGVDLDAPVRRHRPPRLRIGAMALVISAVAFACTGEEFDPAGDAELGIREQIQVELGLESEVTCEEPETTAVGTRFRCHADAEDGTEYDFTAQILEGGVIGTQLD
jgi:hypothetical protein